MLDEEGIEKKIHLPLFARVLVIKFDDKFHLIENAWPHREKMRRGVAEEYCSVFYLFHPWKISVKNSKLFLFWIDWYCDRFFGVYLLQLISLKKMWHAQILAKCFFSKAESINFEINSIDASCAAYRDEDVAGRWAKILLPLRGDMFCNSRREIRKIASSTGHDRKNSLLFVSIIWRNLIKYRQISERR